jgi:hypothetical protein
MIDSSPNKEKQVWRKNYTSSSVAKFVKNCNTNSLYEYLNGRAQKLYITGGYVYKQLIRNEPVKHIKVISDSRTLMYNLTENEVIHTSLLCKDTRDSHTNVVFDKSDVIVRHCECK